MAENQGSSGRAPYLLAVIMERVRLTNRWASERWEAKGVVRDLEPPGGGERVAFGGASHGQQQPVRIGRFAGPMTRDLEALIGEVGKAVVGAGVRLDDVDGHVAEGLGAARLVPEQRHALDGHTLRVSADADTVVEIDPRIASMALSHLLENAAHYSARDHQIAIDARALSDELRVTVTDAGPGLDPDESEHLFERFFRGRRARQLVPGTGMGLAITRGLLSAAGGRVWAENAPNAGARFTIVLPGRTRAAVVSQ